MTTRELGATLAVRLSVLVAVLVAGYLVGRCAPPPPPAKVERELVADVRQEVQVKEAAKTATVRRTTRTDTRPDGRQVVTVTDERTDQASEATTGIATVAKVVERELVIREVRSSWRAGVTAGWELLELHPRPDVLGASLERRIVGPLWLGAWARTDRTAGLSLALEW